MNETVRYDWQIVRYQDNHYTVVDESIATEYPLTIFVNGEEFATMVCSPTEMNDLVFGFLASEGIIRKRDDVMALTVDEERGFAYVELHVPLNMEHHDHSKRVIGSCCGKSRQFYFKSDVRTAKTVTSHQMISPRQCYHLMEEMQNQSEYFQQTGGVHNAALCTVDCVLEVRTDIGRHNALDKLYGHILQNNVHLKDKVIVFSGRVSSEVLLKISKIGIGIIISKSAPTDLALELANDLGVTVIGFVRGKKMNVYTNPQRIQELPSHADIT